MIFQKSQNLPNKLPKIHIKFSKLPKIQPQIIISVPVAPLRSSNRVAFVIFGEIFGHFESWIFIFGIFW